MLLANTFKRLNSDQPNKVLPLFLDRPSAPLGIHSLCEQGRISMAKEPGDWYGVNSITQVIQDLFEKEDAKESIKGQLSVVTMSEFG